MMKTKSSIGLSVCILLLYFSTHVKSQVIKIENGVAISTLRVKRYSFGTITPYQMAIGMNYWDNSWFNLSSNIGYISKGSTDKIPIQEEPGEVATEMDFNYYANYLTLNTTFQIKKDIRRETYYIGVGPRVDFKVKEKNNILEDKFNSVLYGLKCEAGLNYTINKLQVGFNASYLPSFNKSIANVRERTFSLGLSVGYVLN